MAANWYTDIHTHIDEVVFVSLDEAGDTLGSEGVEGFGSDSHPVYNRYSRCLEGGVPEGRAKTCISASCSRPVITSLFLF